MNLRDDLMRFSPFHRQDLKKGILLVVLGWLCFSSVYMLSKLMDKQTTVPTMLFFRNIIGLLVVLPYIIKKWPKSIKTKNRKIILIRAFVSLLNLMFIFLAVKKISLVNTTLINNSAPFFVPFILWFWLKSPIEYKLWPAILIGFIGIALILDPDKKIFNVGAIYALLSGICLAIATITMRISSRYETIYAFMFQFFLVGLILSAPFAILDWKVDNALTLLGLLSMSLFSGAGQCFLFYGLKHGKAQQLAPFSYAAVIFSGMYEWIIWGVSPKPLAYLGIILIILAGIWIVHYSKPPKEL